MKHTWSWTFLMALLVGAGQLAAADERQMPLGAVELPRRGALRGLLLASDGLAIEGDLVLRKGEHELTLDGSAVQVRVVEDTVAHVEADVVVGATDAEGRLELAARRLEMAFSRPVGVVVDGFPALLTTFSFGEARPTDGAPAGEQLAGEVARRLLETASATRPVSKHVGALALTRLDLSLRAGAALELGDLTGRLAEGSVVEVRDLATEGDELRGRARLKLQLEAAHVRGSDATVDATTALVDVAGWLQVRPDGVRAGSDIETPHGAVNLQDVTLAAAGGARITCDDLELEVEHWSLEGEGEVTTLTAALRARSRRVVVGGDTPAELELPGLDVVLETSTSPDRGAPGLRLPAGLTFAAERIAMPLGSGQLELERVTIVVPSTPVTADGRLGLSGARLRAKALRFVGRDGDQVVARSGACLDVELAPTATLDPGTGELSEGAVMRVRAKLGCLEVQPAGRRPLRFEKVALDLSIDGDQLGLSAEGTVDLDTGATRLSISRAELATDARGRVGLVRLAAGADLSLADTLATLRSALLELARQQNAQVFEEFTLPPFTYYNGHLVADRFDVGADEATPNVLHVRAHGGIEARRSRRRYGLFGPHDDAGTKRLLSLRVDGTLHVQVEPGPLERLRVRARATASRLSGELHLRPLRGAKGSVDLGAEEVFNDTLPIVRPDVAERWPELLRELRVERARFVRRGDRLAIEVEASAPR